MPSMRTSGIKQYNQTIFSLLFKFFSFSVFKFGLLKKMDQCLIILNILELKELLKIL